MADPFTQIERSNIMRSVKSSGNKSTELKVITIFRRLKISGWRRNYKLSGKPDIVFPKKKIALFVDGCFWHGHSCRNTKPRHNKKYWTMKIRRNKARDKKVTKLLQTRGWTVVRFWECQISADRIQKLRLNE